MKKLKFLKKLIYIKPQLVEYLCFQSYLNNLESQLPKKKTF
jgi:hypothetical protein